VLTTAGPAPAWVLASRPALPKVEITRLRQALAAIPPAELEAAGFASIRPSS
jgi:phosphonate transport system substrate-binding protein